MDKPADPIDQSSDITLAFTQESVDAVRRAARPKQTKILMKQEDGSVMMDWPIKECVACGDDIPEGRLDTGAITCIQCETEKEKRNALYGKR